MERRRLRIRGSEAYPLLDQGGPGLPLLDQGHRGLPPLIQGDPGLHGQVHLIQGKFILTSAL